MSEEKSIIENYGFVSESTKQGIVLDLLKVMEEEHLSGSDLGNLLGYSRQHISQMLNGQYNFTISKLAKVAVKLKRQLVVRMIDREEFMPIIPTRRIKEFRHWNKVEKINTPIGSSTTDFSAGVVCDSPAPVVDIIASAAPSYTPHRSQQSPIRGYV